MGMLNFSGQHWNPLEGHTLLGWYTKSIFLGCQLLINSILIVAKLSRKWRWSTKEWVVLGKPFLGPQRPAPSFPYTGSIPLGVGYIVHHMFHDCKQPLVSAYRKYSDGSLSKLVYPGKISYSAKKKAWGHPLRITKFHEEWGRDYQIPWGNNSEIQV